MAIVPLRKVTLIGVPDERDAWIEPLQTLGVMHVDLWRETSHGQDPIIGLPEKAQESLRYLQECPQKIKPWRLENAEDIRFIIEEILENKTKRRQLLDLRDDYHQFIQMRKEWGDFQFPDVNALGGYYFWFYVVPQSQLHKLDACPHPWEVVDKKQGRCYVIVLSQHEPTKIEIPFKRVRAGYKSLSQLYRELDQVERDLDTVQLERVSLSRWLNVLSHHLNMLIDQAELGRVAGQFSEADSLCCLFGWVPEPELEKVQIFASNNGLVCVSEEVPLTTAAHPDSTQNEPPTLLKSHPLISGAKQVVQFFQTPAYGTWDPSLVVFVSFNIFFAMILSDAGYALLSGLIVRLYRKKIRGQSIGIYRLMQSVSLSALVWGLMVGSYFGFSPPEDSWFSVIKVIDLNDFDFMIQLSVGIGVLHLVVANISAGLARHNRWLAIGDMGWVLVFLSGFSMFVFGGGMAGIALGLILIFLFSSERTLFPNRRLEIRVLLFRLLDGMKALTGFSKGFGDVLSYMRLFALGLSSAQLAITFNGIANDVREEIPGIGLLLAILILFLGHLLNFVLGVMGGVIHGLRLNLIEFLNWGVKSEGYPFKAFAKQEDVRWKQ
ncbi:MAG: hypothetical protein MI976_09980 [Pseudomonadales bacterium]|nr:hypothetical protein [Pseudomonadales bacterium]